MYMACAWRFCDICGCSMLATKLNMSSEDAEKWIVNLIRNAKLDAKIDAKEVSFSSIMTQPIINFMPVIYMLL